MNVTANQEKKKKNEEAKTGIKKVGERRRQSTDFRKPACCHFAVVQAVAGQKIGSRKVPGVTWTLGKTRAIST